MQERENVIESIYILLCMKDNKSFMKALFVLHTVDFIYGASRSISGILQNIEYDYDLMICQSFTKKINEIELKRKFGKHLKNIYVVWLPRYRCQIYDKAGWFSECSHIVNNIMAFLQMHKRKRIICQGGYDYVHLNSPVLFPIIDNNAKYIVHARDIINPEYKKINDMKKALKAVSGIIYIDKATKVSVEKEIINPQNTIINNPFDMTEVRDVDYEESLKQYGLSSQNIIFAMLGQIAEMKGSQLVLRAFMKHTNPNSRLLIVGNDNHVYAKECKKMAETDGRIIFCGELKDTRGIYRISDYIMRGDPQYCIGRTIYEGLFAGTGVIIPGRHSDLEGMPNQQEFEQSIHLYNPQDEEDLAKVISECSEHKMMDRKYGSNIKEYMEKYYAFINRVVQNKGE